MRIAGTLLVAASAVCTAAAAQDAAAAPVFDAARLTEFATEVSSCFDVVGMGVALTNRDETLYAEGVGLRDMEAQLPVDGDTTFSVASTTKAWTTALTAVLIGEGEQFWNV
jgi:CubicO group peptidase (beta-lactamase class C family)